MQNSSSFATITPAFVSKQANTMCFTVVHDPDGILSNVPSRLDIVVPPPLKVHHSIYDFISGFESVVLSNAEVSLPSVTIPSAFEILSIAFAPMAGSSDVNPSFSAFYVTRQDLLQYTFSHKELFCWTQNALESLFASIEPSADSASLAQDRKRWGLWSALNFNLQLQGGAGNGYSINDTSVGTPTSPNDPCGYSGLKIIEGQVCIIRLVMQFVVPVYSFHYSLLSPHSLRTQFPLIWLHGSITMMQSLEPPAWLISFQQWLRFRQSE